MPSKCIACNLKHPNFNHKDEQKALYSNTCKLENLVDIKHKQCITCKIKKQIAIVKMKKTIIL